MPLSVEMPAPVSAVIRVACVSQSGRGSGTVPVTSSTVRVASPGAQLRELG
jgi:hypothetical protein